jgi:hypothetical protein
MHSGSIAGALALGASASAVPMPLLGQSPETRIRPAESAAAAAAASEAGLQRIEVDFFQTQQKTLRNFQGKKSKKRELKSCENRNSK